MEEDDLGCDSGIAYSAKQLAKLIGVTTQLTLDRQCVEASADAGTFFGTYLMRSMLCVLK
jgi:hypothetical protein